MFCHSCGSNSGFIPNPPPSRSTWIPTFVLWPLQKTKETWYRSPLNRSAFGKGHAKRTNYNGICRRCEMPSSLRVGAEVQIQHLSEAKASSGSGSAFASSENGGYIEDTSVKRLAVVNPDPSSSLSSPSSSSSSFSKRRPRSQSRAHIQIQQPADSLMTGMQRKSRALNPNPGSNLPSGFHSRSRGSSSRFSAPLTASSGQAGNPRNSPDRIRSPIVQPAAADLTGSDLYNPAFESSPAPPRAQECLEALARSKPVFHARNSPHLKDGLVSQDIYSLRSKPEDGPMLVSSTSSSSARSTSPSPAPASSPQREPKTQTQAPSTAYTNMSLPRNDTASRRIVIHLSSHGPGPRIIPQKDGVFIQTKYAVEIASVQFGSGTYNATPHCSNSAASTSVSSFRPSAGSSASSSSTSEVSASPRSTPTLSPSPGFDSTATNEIAGLDISKVKPAYFYRVLRAGTVSMQGAASKESVSAQRRRRRERRIRGAESDWG